MREHSFRTLFASSRWLFWTTSFSSTRKARDDDEDDLLELPVLNSFSQFQPLKAFPGVFSELSSSLTDFMLNVWIYSSTSSEFSSSFKTMLTPDRFEETLLDLEAASVLWDFKFKALYFHPNLSRKFFPPNRYVSSSLYQEAFLFFLLAILSAFLNFLSHNFAV